MDEWLNQPAGMLAILFDIVLVVLAIALAIGISL